MPLIIKIENIIKIWSMRDLTIYGKTSVTKAHLQSQLVYQMSVLPSPPKVFFDKVDVNICRTEMVLPLWPDTLA